MTTKTAPTLADIEAARERIGDHARVTPVYGSESLLARDRPPTLLKAENLQRTGSFKIRGAVNKLATLSPAERAAGVSRRAPATTARRSPGRRASSASAATIFMPQDAPMAKVEPTLTYGGEAVLGGAGFEEALAEALRARRGDRRHLRPRRSRTSA